LTRSPRKAALAFALAVAPLLSTVAFTAEAFCTQPTAKAQTGTSGLTTTQNFGIYDWDESAQAWVLDQAGYAAFAESETLQAGDISIPATVFSGGSGGGGGGGGGGTQVELQADELPTDAHQGSSKTGTSSLCDEPVKMPATVVVGFRPTGGVGFLRLSVFRGGGGGGGRSGIGRPTLTLDAAYPDDSCGTELGLRKDHARTVLAQARLWKQGAMATIRYQSGEKETFRVKSVMSFVGAEPVGACR